MSETPRCGDTLSENTQNSSLPKETGKPRKSDKSSRPKPSASSPSAATPEKFQLYDLQQLTFNLIGSDIPADAWHADAAVFGSYVQQFVQQDVATRAWALMDRVDFLNALWAFCEQHQYPFPFTLGKMLTAGESEVSENC